jgi:hypothetical protein
LSFPEHATRSIETPSTSAVRDIFMSGYLRYRFTLRSPQRLGLEICEPEIGTQIGTKHVIDTVDPEVDLAAYQVLRIPLEILMN